MKPETVQRILKFSSDRDWDQFHTPANLAKSISIETGISFIPRPTLQSPSPSRPTSFSNASSGTRITMTGRRSAKSSPM